MTESTIRRRARRLGLRIHKDRARTRSINHCGEFMLVNASRNLIVAGERYDMSLADIDALLRI